MDTKNFNKEGYIFYLILILITIYGCTKSGVYKITIKNESRYNIMIVGYMRNSSVAYSAVDSFLINQNETKVISKIFPEDYITYCNPHPFDSIRTYIINNTNLNVAIDLFDNDRYVYSKTGSKSKGYTVECRATITDADIVPK
jgi:hypothetical protein